MSGAFLVTLVRPASWAMGLAGFLAGGGIVIMTWPILVLPTPTGLQNALGAPVSSLVFGSPSGQLLGLVAAGILLVLAILTAALVAGAWAERQGIEIALAAAVDEGLITVSPDMRGAPGTGRVAVIRLLSLVPVAVALALAWKPLYDVTYHELILPDDLVTPLPIRVIGALPWLLAGILATWLVSDTAAAEGVRRLVLERRSVPVAWALGWLDLVRRPLRVFGAAILGLAALVLLTGPSLLVGGDRLAAGPRYRWFRAGTGPCARRRAGLGGDLARRPDPRRSGGGVPVQRTDDGGGAPLLIARSPRPGSRRSAGASPGGAPRRRSAGPELPGLPVTLPFAARPGATSR